MAKLIVYFKDKIVHSGLYRNGLIHVGRDEANDLVIDSLAVAPVHAAIIIHDDGSTVKRLTADFPVSVNGEKIKEKLLVNNDTITVGKHDVVFKSAEPNQQVQALREKANHQINQDVQSLNKEIGPELKLPDANLQVIAGENIGKLIPLKNSLTRLVHDGSGLLVIEKRKDAYFVSALKNQGKLLLNKQPLSDAATPISHYDILTIDDTSLQFFRN